MLGLFRLLRLAALRELRGGWMLMIGAASLLVIAAALVALPLVFQAASADLALRELIEQSPRGATFADQTRLLRPADPDDFEQVAEDARRFESVHLEAIRRSCRRTRAESWKRRPVRPISPAWITIWRNRSLPT